MSASPSSCVFSAACWVAICRLQVAIAFSASVFEACHIRRIVEVSAVVKGMGIASLVLNDAILAGVRLAVIFLDLRGDKLLSSIAGVELPQVAVAWAVNYIDYVRHGLLSPLVIIRSVPLPELACHP